MTFGRLALAIALFSSACSAQVSDGGARLGDLDAGVGDDATTAQPDAALDAAPVALCNKRVLYLNFEGQALTRGKSDATLNRAEWMTDDNGTAPPYRKDDGDRATQIKDITDGVRAQLVGFPITVTTTRPATGEYVMVVLGGRQGQVKSAFGSAVNRLDCDDSRHNDVAWVSDGVTGKQRIINTIIGAVGFGVGLTAVDDPADCMCAWDNDCTPDDNNACKLGSPAARDPNARQKCAGADDNQDEVAFLKKAFCG